MILDQSFANSFYKYLVFSNTRPDRIEFFRALQSLVKHTYENPKNSFIDKLKYAISIVHIKERVVTLIDEKNEQSKAAWMLSKCQLSELLSLDQQGAALYFQQLEITHRKQYEDVLQSQQIYLLLKDIRNEFFFGLFKNNLNKIFFLSIFLSALLFGIIFMSKDSSFTVWQLLKGWFHFLF